MTNNKDTEYILSRFILNISKSFSYEYFEIKTLTTYTNHVKNNYLLHPKKLILSVFLPIHSNRYFLDSILYDYNIRLIHLKENLRPYDIELRRTERNAIERVLVNSENHKLNYEIIMNARKIILRRMINRNNILSKLSNKKSFKISSIEKYKKIIEIDNIIENFKKRNSNHTLLENLTKFTFDKMVGSIIVNKTLPTAFDIYLNQLVSEQKICELPNKTLTFTLNAIFDKLLNIKILNLDQYQKLCPQYQNNNFLTLLFSVTYVEKNILKIFSNIFKRTKKFDIYE